MIAIVAASKHEIKGLIWRLKGPQTQKLGKNRVYTGRIGQNDVLVGISGIGPFRAKKFFDSLLQKFNISAYISTGFCGALSQELNIGDILIGQKVSNDEDGRISIQELVINGPPLITPKPSDLFNRVFYGTIHHVDHIVEDAKEKARLREITGAEAIDMESYVLSQEAKKAGIPFLTIRAVSDEASHDLNVGFKKFISPSGGISVFKAIWHLMTRPVAAYNVFRLQRTSRIAARKQVDFLENYLNTI